jgi:membrane protein required for colicin V production
MPNLVDILIVVLVAYEALAGLDRGFLRQTATLVGMLLGIGAALLGHSTVARLLSPLVPNPSWASAIAFVFVALAVWLGFIALSRQADEGLKQAGWEWLNRLVGLAIGLLVGLLLSAGLLLILARIPSLVPREAIQQSRLAMLILQVLPGLGRMLPGDLPLLR